MSWKTVTIGLTGGIGSGKSNVGKILTEFGAKHIDADVVGHSVYEPSTAVFSKLVNTFGSEIVADGKINRKVLGTKVFGNPQEMKRLTDIVWPAIAEKTSELISQVQLEKKHSIIVVEAAVLIEANWKPLVDTVWVTVVPPHVAKERIMRRNNLSEEEAQRRIDSQISNEERIKHADTVIDTDGPMEQTRARVEKQWLELKQKYFPTSTL